MARIRLGRLKRRCAPEAGAPVTMAKLPTTRLFIVAALRFQPVMTGMWSMV